jgi:enoyl-CoA hydratase
MNVWNVFADRGIKKTMLYSRDHTTRDSLEQIKLWNAAHLLSEDLNQAMVAVMTKTPAVFKD